MHIINKTCAGLAAAAALLLMSACGSAKKTGTGTDTTRYTDIPEALADQTPEQRVYSVAQTYKNWTDLQTDLQLSLEAPKSLTFSAKCYMKRNEWVQISVRMLGFEVMQLWADRDSVHVVDKYHKYLVSESIGTLAHGVPVTIGDVQDLLLGRGFLLGSGTWSATAPQLTLTEATPQGLIVVPRTQPDGLEYGFILSAVANRLVATSLSAAQGTSVTAAYSNFATVGGAGEFAGFCGISAHTGSAAASAVKVAVEWRPASAKWNSGLRRTWQRPSGYKRISASSLLSALKNL